MTDEQWGESGLNSLTIYIGGSSIEMSARGEPVTDADVLWMINTDPGEVEFTVPDATWGEAWRCVLDTATGEIDPAIALVLKPGDTIGLIGRSAMLFVGTPTEDD
jgi:glycogen operon protein